MQTFLPYPSFDESARVLDYRRLGKQRVECEQILNALESGIGWIHHPATKMWKGFENSLIEYQLIIIGEWLDRGYRNNMIVRPFKGDIVAPNWLGNEEFHRSHRANLMRKDPEYYGRFFGNDFSSDEYLNIEYVWPV